MHLMIDRRTWQSFRSVSRRAFTLTDLQLCLSMATTNIIGAFAADSATNTASWASVSPYLEEALNGGSGKVIVTLSSLEAKKPIISNITSELGLEVRNDLDSLPIITLEDVKLADVEALFLLEGIVSIEPELELTSTKVNYIEAIKASDLTFRSNPQSAPVSLDGTGRTIGIIYSGINANPLQFQNKQRNDSRIIAQGCVNQDDIEIAPCSTVPNQSAQINCSVNSGACTHGHAVASFAAGALMSLEGNSFKTEIKGSAPNANISFFRIADSDRNGPTNISLLTGFNKFLSGKSNNPGITPDVVNSSIGFPYKDFPSCNQFRSLNLAINSLVSVGVTVVVSSGNESNKSHITSPACL